jgi:proline iminopeptidase
VKRRELYDLIEPFDTGFLQVGSGHEIYYEQSGNPRGKPALFVHGGPGGGGDVNARRFFDPDGYRIVIFDQRGSGRSRPHASLEANTTWDLVADIEALRGRLGIERWLVFGGSWGSTLALAYAETHPRHVSELVLRGIFRAPQRDRLVLPMGRGHAVPGGVARLPRADPAGKSAAICSARIIAGPQAAPAEQLAAPRACSPFGRSVNRARSWPNPERKTQLAQPEFALAARDRAHYFVNRGFFTDEDQLLRGVDRIRDIPAVLMQAATIVSDRDGVGTAGALARSRLPSRAQAGHTAYEPGITSEPVAATDRFLGLGARP